MKHSEYDEQVKVISWYKSMLKYNKIPSHYRLFSTDASAKRTKPQQARYKASGGTSGVCDLCLSVPMVNSSSQLIYTGLYIEMKSPELKPVKSTSKGGLSNNQIEFINDLRKCQYKVEVCYTANDAIRILEDYLGTIMGTRF